MYNETSLKESKPCNFEFKKKQKHIPLLFISDCSTVWHNFTYIDVYFRYIDDFCLMRTISYRYVNDFVFVSKISHPFDFCN